MTYTREFLTQQIATTRQGMAGAAENIAASLEAAAAQVRRDLGRACEGESTERVMSEIGNLQSTIGNTLAGLALSPLMTRLETCVMLERELAVIDAVEAAHSASQDGEPSGIDAQG